MVGAEGFETLTPYSQSGSTHSAEMPYFRDFCFQLVRADRLDGVEMGGVGVL